MEFVTVFEHRVDEPFRTFTEGCCGTIRTIEAGGDKYILLKENIDIAEQSRAEQSNSDISNIGCQVIGDLFQENGYGSAAGRVYDKKGLAPCLGAAHFSQVKYIVVKV